MEARDTGLHYIILTGLPSTALSALVVAAAAIHRPTFSRLEGYLRLSATLSTYRGEHLAIGPTTTAIATTGTLPSSRLTAGWASFGLVGVPLFGEELLLFGAEGNTCAAIGTLQRLVIKGHEMTASIILVG